MNPWYKAFAGMTLFGLGPFPLVLASPSQIFDPPREMVVRANVADIRAKPIRHSNKYEYDILQETQVLEGERVLVHEKEGRWVRVECPEQMEFTHHSKWEGYPGWIEFRALTSKISNYPPLQKWEGSQKETRRRILFHAARHIGTKYLWGGRSLYDRRNSNVLTGVDCSGLVNWSYRQVGWLIPRDAHEQYLKAKPIEPSQLQPADLIFLAHVDKPGKIVHVAIYAGKNEIMEAPQTNENVQQISFQTRFGMGLETLKNANQIGDKIIYFGSFLGIDNE